MSDSSTCPVCWERLREPVAKLACGHFFCDECIGNSIRMVANNVPSCPICRCQIQEYRRHESIEDPHPTAVIVVPNHHHPEPLIRMQSAPLSQRACWWVLIGTSLFMFLFNSLYHGVTLNHCHLMDTSGGAVCYYSMSQPPETIQYFCFTGDEDATAAAHGHDDSPPPPATEQPLAPGISSTSPVHGPPF